MGALSIVLLSDVVAADMPVPGKVQGAIFKKIFGYDKQLRDKQELVVLVVGGSRDEQATQEIVTAFVGDGVSPAVADIESLAAPISDAVVYLMPDADVELARKYCTDHGVLSISGVPTFAEQGWVSVGLDIDGDRPQIVVNLQRLAAEGHSFSAEILRVSSVVR